MTSLDTQFNALVTAVKAQVGSQVMPALRAFLDAEGIECSAEMMGRLEAVMGKIVVNPTKETVGGKGKGKGKAVLTAKTPDMSERCQGCDWKGGKIKNAWCKKGGEHSFLVDGETVKCCTKHFTAWESVSGDPLKGRVGYAVSPGGNGRTGTVFLGFFGVSATNSSRRIPVFPGEYYAMQVGVSQDTFGGDDKPKPGWVDKAMDMASLNPEIKNGRKKGVYMPSGGWEGAAESVKLDKEVYKLADDKVIPAGSSSSTPPVEDLTEDPVKVDEGIVPVVAVDYRDNLQTLTRDVKSGDVYLTPQVVKWLGEEEQVNAREYKSLRGMVVNKSCGKYTNTDGIVDIDWHDGAGGPMEEAVSTYIDLMEGSGDGN